MPRHPHEPTEQTRQAVRLHATVGTNQDLISDILGITAKTLRLHYREELDQSRAKANAQVGGALYKKALSGDTGAMIFWMKTQAGWKETTVNEQTGPGGGPIQTEDVTNDADAFSRRMAILSARANDAGGTGEADTGDEGSA